MLLWFILTNGPTPRDQQELGQGDARCSGK